MGEGCHYCHHWQKTVTVTIIYSSTVWVRAVRTAGDTILPCAEDTERTVAIVVDIGIFVNSAMMSAIDREGV